MCLIVAGSIITEIESDVNLQLGLDLVTSDERTRICSLLHAADRHRALVGRLLIRKCLADILKVSPASLQLGRSPLQRPILIDPPSPIDFNIAHHGSWVVLIASLHHQVGCDLVCLPQTSDPDQWLKTMNAASLTPNEIRLVEAWSVGRHRLAQFMVLWALKESYLKAIGVGLHMELQRLEFQRHPAVLDNTYQMTDPFPDCMLGEYCLLCDCVLVQEWRFTFIKLDTDHLACFASKPFEANQSDPPIADLIRYSFRELTCL